MARQQVHNLWENGEKLEVYIYTSEDHEPFTNRGAMFAQGPLYHNTSVFGDSLSLKSAAPVRFLVPKLEGKVVFWACRVFWRGKELCPFDGISCVFHDADLFGKWLEGQTFTPSLPFPALVSEFAAFSTSFLQHGSTLPRMTNISRSGQRVHPSWCPQQRDVPVRARLCLQTWLRPQPLLQRLAL